MNNKVRFTTLAGMRIRLLPALAIAVALACGSDSPPAPRPQLDCSPATDWTQMGRTPDHAGTVCASGGPLTGPSIAVLAPNLAQETAEERGALLVHYQVPLVVGDDVYASVKSGGTYLSCSPPGSRTPFPCGPDAWDRQIWNEQHFVWQGNQLVPSWIVPTDWKPPPNRGTSPGTASLGDWEPQFHAVVSGDSLWMPAGSGGVMQIDRLTGQLRNRIDPFKDVNVFVAGPLTATASGDILYTAIRLD